MENVADIYRPTPVQEGILFHSLSSPGDGVYLSQFHCRIEGTLEVEKFKSAWARAFARHEVLRTMFLWEDVDEPLQVVRETVEVPWRDDVDGRNFESLLGEDRAEDFSFTEAPLCRLRLWSEGEGGWRFLWTYHHIILDGWSAPMVFREVLDDYAGKSPVPGLAFGEYVAWAQARDRGQEEAFWASRLAPVPDVPRLEIHSRERETISGWGQVERRIGQELFEGLRDLARSNALTMNTVVHGAWALAVACYQGTSDFFVGTTVSGRPPDLGGVETVVGCCINTLPLRISIQDADPLVDWLVALQGEHVVMRDHETASLARLQAQAGLRAGESLFDSIVVFENYPQGFEAPEESGIVLRDADVSEHSHYPLALLAVPEDHDLRVLLVHERDVHEGAAAGKLLACFVDTLRWFASSPGALLRDRPDMSAEDRDLVTGWSTSPMPVQRTGTVLEHLATDDRPAIVYRGRDISYAELNRQAGVIAGELIHRGAKRGERIGLCIERTPEMVYAIWGVLRAGCAYVPLDPAYPAHRLDQVIADSEVRLVLTGRGLRQLEGVSLVFVEELEGEMAERLPVAEDLAYVIYTSGSTGPPRGVGVTHANLQYSTSARRAYYEEPVGRFLLLSSISFDSSVAGIFWTLCGGGTLVLPAEGEEQDVEALAGIIQSARVTHTLCLPSLYNVILQHAPLVALRTLQVVAVAGESCPPDLCRRHHEALPDCRLFNEYGPTEATVWCSVWESRDRERASMIPIGRPIPGAQLHVLNPERRPLPVGVAGELYVGGPGVVPGYWRDEASTAKRFTDGLYRTGDLACWVEDGNLLFLGRSDDQIKIRGHRIEAGEVQGAIAECGEVGEVVVVAEGALDDPGVEPLVSALKVMEDWQIERLIEEATA